MTGKLGVLTAILISVLFLLVFTAGATTVSGEAPAGGEPDGKSLFEKNTCNMCHSVSAAGIQAKTKAEKLKGPDLSGFESQKTFADFADFAAFARGQKKVDDKTHKKPFKGTDEELQTIIDWLGSLEAQK